MPRYRKKPEEVDAIQITSEMFNKQSFPACCTIKQIPWEGPYARELQLKHGPLEVPFLMKRSGHERLTVGDWILFGDDGEPNRCEDVVFKALYEPVAQKR